MKEFQLGVFQLELPSQAYVELKDIDWFLWALSYHGGIRFLRVFDIYKGAGPVIQPFLKNNSGKNVANKMNPKFLDRLKYIQTKAASYGMRLIVDPFYCYGVGKTWYPWTKGKMSVVVNGKGYDTWLWDQDDVGLKAREVYFSQLAEALGPGKFEAGLGNEICLPREQGLCYWAYRTAELWRKLKCVDFAKDRKLWINGHIHQLCGTFSSEVPGEVESYVYSHGGPWPDNSHVCVYHVVGEPAAVVAPYSGRVILVGGSDDGCNFIDRPDIKGHCETNAQGKPRWCGPTGAVRAATFAQAYKLWLTDPKKLSPARQVGQKNGRCFKYLEVGARETQVMGRTNLRALDIDDTLKLLAAAYKKATGSYPPNWHNYHEPK